MQDINWGLLAQYIIPDDSIDFDDELGGRPNCNRQTGFSTQRVVCGSGGGEALRLLAELNALPENERPSRMDGEVPASYCNITYKKEKITSNSSGRPSDSIASLRRVSVRGGDRRCNGRAVRVHTVWPDPATGCVYGGTCALQFRSPDEHSTCTHPPVQPGSAFQNNDKNDARGFLSSHGTRTSVPYASRVRWDRKRKKLDRQGKSGVEANGTITKIQKT